MDTDPALPTAAELHKVTPETPAPPERGEFVVAAARVVSTARLPTGRTRSRFVMVPAAEFNALRDVLIREGEAIKAREALEA